MKRFPRPDTGQGGIHAKRMVHLDPPYATICVCDAAVRRNFCSMRLLVETHVLQFLARVVATCSREKLAVVGCKSLTVGHAFTGRRGDDCGRFDILVVTGEPSELQEEHHICVQYTHEAFPLHFREMSKDKKKKKTRAPFRRSG